MYEFQARVPLDHALTLVKNIRSGNYVRGDNLVLVGAITGEIGALLKTGIVVSLGESDDTPATLDGCCAAIEATQQPSVSEAEAAFDPTILIPVIIKLIELWIARRGK